MSITKYNKETFKKAFENVNLEGKQRVTLAELFITQKGEPKRFDALLLSNKGKYGMSTLVVMDDCTAWLPSHMTDTVKEILRDDETVEDIKEGKCAIIVREYEKEGRVLYSVDFVDFVAEAVEP